MARIASFENMRVWQKSKELNLDLYAAFKDCSDRTFKNQILRAGISVMNNLAEGFERDSDKDFVRFLFIAKGSAGEIRSMLNLAGDLGYISVAKQQYLSDKTVEISKMTATFIKSLRKTL